MSPYSRRAPARLALAFFLPILGALAAVAQSVYTPYSFVNLAGRPGSAGSLDGTGTNAQFNIPHSLAIDGAGNLFVADTFNHTIRKVTPAGEVSVIAGSPGNKGFVDGVGNAEAPRFNSPIGLASDASGNLYVADNGNQTLRKVTPAGTVTRLAGVVGTKGSLNGPSASATFNSPNAIAIDGNGNVFVSDLVNRVIRRIAPDGTVSTFAGTVGQQGATDGTGATARFTAPMGITVDSQNNLYVADQGGSTIRKITPAGVVSTLAGKGKQNGATDGTGADARFNAPEGVAVAPDGMIYVADTANQLIRRITPDGVVSTVAGVAGEKGSTDGTNTLARFNTPRGITVGKSGTVYVTDSANSTIRKLVVEFPLATVTTLAGEAGENGAVDAPGNQARFHFPYGIATDPAGNVYAIDRNNDSIRKVAPDGTVTTFAGIPGDGGSQDGTGGAALFYGPEELKVDASGSVFVVEHFNNTVRKLTPNGSNWIVTTIAGCASCPAGTNDGPGLAARFDGPFGLTLDRSGNVFVADTGSKTVRKVSPGPGGWTVSTFAGAPRIGGALDGTGTAARLSAPIALATDAQDNLFLADGPYIRKISPAGSVTTIAGQFINGSADGPGPSASFGLPRGIAVDQSGTLFVADTANHLIRRLTAAGAGWTVTTLAGKAGFTGAKDGEGEEARFNQPNGIAADTLGNVFVVEAGSHRVSRGKLPGSVVLQPPVIEVGPGTIQVGESAIVLQLQAGSPGTAIIEGSSDLKTWVPLRTNSIAGNAVGLTLPRPANANGFFRIRLEP